MNIPVCAIATTHILHLLETHATKIRIDVVGFVLLVIWSGALQVMLKSGRECGGFASMQVVVLAVTAIGFAAPIWELTADNLMVDPRMLRHCGFTVGTLAVALYFGDFFVSLALLSQWPQLNPSYTATSAGHATAFIGVTAVLMLLVAAFLTNTINARFTVIFGVLWLSVYLLRTRWYEGALAGTGASVPSGRTALDLMMQSHTFTIATNRCPWCWRCCLSLPRASSGRRSSRDASRT